MPSLDSRALQRLASEMHSSEAAEQFAATYIRMLPARVERISQALDNGDDHQAMDAVLSLKASSAMIGALRMEQHCVRLEHALSRTDHSGAVAAGEDIKLHQTELEEALGSTAAGVFPIKVPADGCSCGEKPGTIEPDYAP